MDTSACIGVIDIPAEALTAAAPSPPPEEAVVVPTAAVTPVTPTVAPAVVAPDVVYVQVPRDADHTRCIADIAALTEQVIRS